MDADVANQDEYSMSKKTDGKKCKVCRRLGESICGKKKCAQKRRQSPPGVHGPTQAAQRRKISDYGRQMSEKQKAKAIYGLFEKHLRKYVEHASRMAGNSRVNLRILLETRLDNAVYRIGLAETRRGARQMVNHGLIEVDKKTVSIPSYCLKVGQIITVKERVKKSKAFDVIKARVKNTTMPSWIAFDESEMQGKITSKVQESDFDKSFDAGQIIEFYSR